MGSIDIQRAIRILEDCANVAAGTDFEEIYRMGAEALREKAGGDNPPLTLKQLQDVAENEDDTAVWIYDKSVGVEVRAIIDYIDGIGIVGIWCGDKERWPVESDYGKTWLAYRDRPEGNEI